MIRFALVTGCSKTSIGFLSSQILAATPHKFTVILGCRNEAKGKEAEEAIAASVPGSSVFFKKLDLSSFDSIENFVKEISHIDGFTENGLSLLVNNAGVGWGKNTPLIKTENQIEEIVGVNHFGHFLLTKLLLPYLKKPKSSRIVIVSSSLHDPGANKKAGDVDDKGKLLLPNFPEGILINEKEAYDGSSAYKVSKLCNIWFGYELQRRLNNEKYNIKVVSVSPGFIPTTGLTRRSGMLGLFFLHYIIPFFGVTRTVEEGARAVVSASVGEHLLGGEYVHLPRGATDVEAIQSSFESYNMNKAKDLWELSEKVVSRDACL
jgi:NAD(P)-dependent dehydrogenase (short-subunit alcohol dehydrogenase family)|eukprot:g11526.t1